MEMIVTCKNCGGNGEYYTDVAVIDYVNGGFFDDKLVTCEECDGHGEIEVDSN
jgi:DnaJ-class molecular chaperone